MDMCWPPGRPGEGRPIGYKIGHGQLMRAYGPIIGRDKAKTKRLKKAKPTRTPLPNEHQSGRGCTNKMSLALIWHPGTGLVAVVAACEQHRDAKTHESGCLAFANFR